ncbi:MAG: Yip1 family protein [Usitatibacter sp.]
MGLVDRVKNIIITPKSEWDVIAAEATPPKSIVTGYVLPLAAVSAVAGFIGMCFVGVSTPFTGTIRIGIGWGLAQLLYHLIMAVVMVFVLGFIIDALAPTFGAQKSMPQAVKVAAYAYTPVWVLGILTIIPSLGILVLLAAIYAVYLLFLGLPRVMRGPEEKAAGYTAVVVVVAIVLGIIIRIVAGVLMMPAMMGGGVMGGMSSMRGSPSVTYDPNSPMGKLDAYSKKMEEASKRVEAAQKSGDPKKQMEASMAALGTALSGGKGVDPVQLDALKPFLPATFAGLPQTETQSDRSGVAGLMVAKVEARYADSSGKRAQLEVTDTGGAAGLMGLASWMGVQGEHEDANRREVTRKDGNRLVHEEVSKKGGSNKYSIVLNERFVVSANGNVGIDALKSSVNSLDLGKIESLK